MNLRLSTCDCKGKEKVLIIKLFKEKRVLLTKRALFRRGDSNAAITCKILQITASSNSIFFIVMQNNNF